jgi:hypothetical protein
MRKKGSIDMAESMRRAFNAENFFQVMREGAFESS